MTTTHAISATSATNATDATDATDATEAKQCDSCGRVFTHSAQYRFVNGFTLCRGEKACVARVQEQIAAQQQRADAVHAEYVREQDRLAARRYIVTLHYDEHPTLAERVVWQGTGFWVAAEWAQSAAKSLTSGNPHSYVEHTADNATYSAYRRDWTQQGGPYILVGHASVMEVTEPESAQA